MGQKTSRLAVNTGSKIDKLILLTILRIQGAFLSQYQALAQITNAVSA